MDVRKVAGVTSMNMLKQRVFEEFASSFMIAKWTPKGNPQYLPREELKGVIPWEGHVDFRSLPNAAYDIQPRSF